MNSGSSLEEVMFESAKLKVKRANKHISELQAGLIEFVNTKPYEVRSDFDESRGLYGLGVSMTRSVPPEISIILGDVIHNLRSALEHVASDLDFAVTNDRTRSKFPMHETRDNFVDALEKGVIHTNFPEIADVLMTIIKPYKGGNDTLWKIGKLWNIDKHRLPVTTYGVTSITGIKVVGPNGFAYSGEVRVEQGRIAGLVATDRPMTVTDYGQTAFYIQFDEPGLLEADPVIPTLCQMSQLVAQAIDVIEQAFNRSGP